MHVDICGCVIGADIADSPDHGDPVGDSELSRELLARSRALPSNNQEARRSTGRNHMRQRPDCGLRVLSPEIVSDKQEDGFTILATQYLASGLAVAFGVVWRKMLRIDTIVNPTGPVFRHAVQAMKKVPVHLRNGNNQRFFEGVLAPLNFRLLAVASLTPEADLPPAGNPFQALLVAGDCRTAVRMKNIGVNPGPHVVNHIQSQ